MTVLARRWRALGTSALVAVTDEAALEPACDAVAAEIDALDRACSRFRADFDLSRLNAAAGAPVLVTPLLAEAIEVALRAARLTDGDVDPTVGRSMAAIGYDADFTAIGADGPPSAGPLAPAAGWTGVMVTRSPAVVTLAPGTVLDLGATAKALGSDRAAAAAHRAGARGVLVSLGGDIGTAGTPPPGGWQVWVTDDQAGPAGAAGQSIRLFDGGLATSSSTVRRWRRGGALLHHIVDPRSGAPAVSPYRTVSVAAATCVDANIAATAAMVRGAGAVGWLEASGLPARLVSHDGHVLHLNDWPTAAEQAA